MNTDTIIASLQEEVTRHTGLALTSEDEVMRRGHRHKVNTMQAAIEIIEQEGGTVGKSSQRKGAEGERELATLLRGYGYATERGGSMSFGDVPDLVGLPGIHIECKRVEKLNVPEAMQQAVRDAERFEDGIPALFHRRNRQPWLVTLRLEDFMHLYSKSRNGTERNKRNGESRHYPFE